MKRSAARRAVLGAVAIGTLSAVGTIGAPSPALAASCAPAKSEGPTIAGPLYGETNSDTGSGYIGAAGDQGYVELTGNQTGNAALYGASSDGAASGYVGVNGTSTTPNYCVTPSPWSP